MSEVFDASSTQHQQKEDAEEAAADHPNSIEQQSKVPKLLASSPSATNHLKFASQYSPAPSGDQEEAKNSFNNHKSNAGGDFTSSKAKTLLNKLAGGAKVDSPKIGCRFDEETTDEDGQFEHDGTNGEEKNAKYAHPKGSSHLHQLAKNNLSQLNRTNNKTIFDSSSTHPVGTILNNIGDPDSGKSNPSSINPQTTQHFVVHSSSIGSPAAVKSSNPIRNHNNNKLLNGPTSSRNPTNNNHRSPPHSPPPPHSHHHSRLFPPNNFHHNLLNRTTNNNNHQNHHFPLLYNHLAAVRTILPPTIGNEQKGFASPPFPPTSSLICTSPPPPNRPQIHLINCINRQSPVAKPAPVAAAFAVPTLPARPRQEPSSAHIQKQQQKEQRNHLEEAERHLKKEEKVEDNQKQEQKKGKAEVERESEHRKSSIVAQQLKKEKREIVEEEEAEESTKLTASSFSAQQVEEREENKEEALEETIERNKSIEEKEEEEEEPVPSTSAAALQIQQAEKQKGSQEESSIKETIVEAEKRQKSPVKHIRLVLRVSAAAAFQIHRLAKHHSGKALRRIGIGSIQLEEEASKLLKRTTTLSSTSSFTESICASRHRQRRTIPVLSRSPSPGEAANRRARIQQIRQQQQILLQRSQQQLAAALIQHQQRGTTTTASTGGGGGNKTPQSAGKVSATNTQNPLLPATRPVQQYPAAQHTRQTPTICPGGLPNPSLSAYNTLNSGPTHPTTPHLSQPAPSVYPQSTHLHSQQMDQPGPSNIGVVGQHPSQMIGTGQTTPGAMASSMPNQAMTGGKRAAENSSPLLVNLLSNNNVPQNAARTQQPQQSSGGGMHPSNSSTVASNSQQQVAIMNAQQQQQMAAIQQQQQQRGYIGQQQQGVPFQGMPQGISTQQMPQGMQQLPQGMNTQQQQMYHQQQQQQIAQHQQMMSMQYAVGGQMVQTPQNAGGHYMVMGSGSARMRPAGGMPPQQMMAGGPPVMPSGMASPYYMGVPPAMTALHQHHIMATAAGPMIGSGEMKPATIHQAEEPPKKRKRISKKQQQKEERERNDQQQQQIRAQEQQMVQQQQMRMVYIAQQQQRMVAMGSGGGGNGPSPSQQAFGSQMTQQHYQQQMAQYHHLQQQQQQRQSVPQGHPGFQSPLPGSMIAPGYAQTTPSTPGPGPNSIGASPQQQTQQFMGGSQGPYSMMMSPQQQQMWHPGMSVGPSGTGTPVTGQNMSADFHLHQMAVSGQQQQIPPQTPQTHPASVPSFRAPDTPYFGHSPAGGAPTPFQSPPPSSSQQMVGTPGGHQTPTGGHLTPGGSAGTGGAHTPIEPTNGGSGLGLLHQVHTPQPSSATSFGPQFRPQMNPTEFCQAVQRQQRPISQQQNCPPPTQGPSTGTKNQQQEGGNIGQSTSTFPQLMDFAEGGLGDGPELSVGGIANEGIDDFDLDSIEPMRCGEQQQHQQQGHHHQQQQIHAHQQQHNAHGGQQMHPGMMPHGYFVPSGVQAHPMMQMQQQSSQGGDAQQQYQSQNTQQFHQQHRSPQMIAAMQQQPTQIMNQSPPGGHQNHQIDQKAGLNQFTQQQIKEQKASTSAGTSSSGGISVDQQRQMMAADMAMLPDRSPQLGDTPLSPSKLSETQDKNVSDAIASVMERVAKTGSNGGTAKGGAGADGGKSTPGKSRAGPTKRGSQSNIGSNTTPIINNQPQHACSSSAGSLSQHSSSLSRTPTPQTPSCTSITSIAEHNQQFKQRIGLSGNGASRQPQFTYAMPQTTGGCSPFENNTAQIPMMSMMMRKSMDQPPDPPRGQIVQQAQADSSTSTSTTLTTAGSTGQFAHFNGGAHFHIPFGHPHQQNTPSSSTSSPSERKTPLSAPAGKANESPRFDTGTFMLWANSNTGDTNTMSRGRTSSGGGIKDDPGKGDGGEKKPRKRKAKQQKNDGGQEGGGKKQRRGSKANCPNPVLLKSFPIADGNGGSGQMVVAEIAQAESNSSMAPASSTTSSSMTASTIGSARMMIYTEGRPPS